MARHLILGDKAIRSALRVPDQQIKEARDAKAAGLPVTVPKMTRILDGDGLYLLTCVKGVSHAWRFDYVFRGVAKTLSLGKYPAVGLADARSVAADFRALIAKGINPSDERKAEKERVRHELLVEQLVAAGKPPDAQAPGAKKSLAGGPRKSTPSRSAKGTSPPRCCVWSRTSFPGWVRGRSDRSRRPTSSSASAVSRSGVRWRRHIGSREPAARCSDLP